MFVLCKGMPVGKKMMHLQSSFIGTVAVMHRGVSVHMEGNTKEPQGMDTKLMTKLLPVNMQ